MREASDRAAIAKLVWNYCRALDSLNEEAYAAVFTENGQFLAGATTVATGRSGLKEMIAGFKKQRAELQAKSKQKLPPTYHVISNASVEFIDQDHARFYSYWMTVMEGESKAFGGEKDVQPNVAAVGQAVDELVRTQNGWRIQKRDVRPQN